MDTKTEESLDRIEKRMATIEQQQIELLRLVRRLNNISHTPPDGPLPEPRHSFPIIN